MCPELQGLTSPGVGDAAVAEVSDIETMESWAALYRGVLRLRAALEPHADSERGTQFHAEYCDSLRAYLIQHCGVDAERLARVDIEAAVEHENWDAVWSKGPVVLRLHTH